MHHVDFKIHSNKLSLFKITKRSFWKILGDQNLIKIYKIRVIRQIETLDCYKVQFISSDFLELPKI